MGKSLVAGSGTWSIPNYGGVRTAFQRKRRVAALKTATLFSRTITPLSAQMPGAVERSLSRLNRPSRRVAGPGKRHSARGTPRAQLRDVRSAGRDTWNLTGEALGGPRKRSWRRCSRARSGRRSAIRGAHSGALDRPEPSDPAARAPIRTSAPYSAADASGSSCAAGAALSLPTARCWRARGALPV